MTGDYGADLLNAQDPQPHVLSYRSGYITENETGYLPTACSLATDSEERGSRMKKHDSKMRKLLLFALVAVFWTVDNVSCK